jgi:hypothetical protein
MSREADPGCCYRVKSSVVWRAAQAFDGPAEDGWCINANNRSALDPVFVHVTFCPFCGELLRDRSTRSVKQ